MMYGVSELFEALGFFAAVVMIVFFISKNNYQLKKSIIEKGGNIEFPAKKDKSNLRFIECATTLIGIGLGLALGPIMANKFGFENEFIVAIMFADVFIFGGIGMVIGIILRNKANNAKSNK